MTYKYKITILLFLLVTSQAFSQTPEMRRYQDSLDSIIVVRKQDWEEAYRLLQMRWPDSMPLGKLKDTAYWNHITKHSRFKFVKADTTVTGTVSKIFTERDGDLHVILKQGRKILRCEIICYQRVNEACNGFWNHTKRPKIGSKVSITGDYVYDRWHHWHEIHPVKKIVQL